MKTLDDLFLHFLKDMYHAENQLTKALPKMAKKASSDKLADAFKSHLKETEGHVKRLEKVFDIVGKKATKKKCEAIEGLIAEGEELIGDAKDPEMLDAGLIAAAQGVEHYEIARYGALVAWAKQLGRQDAAKLLQETLDEEHAADSKLNSLAETRINRQAA